MFSVNNQPYYVMTTRFTPETLEQNMVYKREHQISKSIYGTPIRVTNVIPRNSVMYILEMLNINDKNNKEWPGRIIGIGVVRNKYERSKNIYTNGNFNRFVYKGHERYDIDDLDDTLVNYIRNVIEPRLFRGRDHSKRGIGITRLPSRINMIEFGNLLKTII